jgi:hypothetical protein
MKHTANEIKEILQKAGLNVEVKELDGKVIVEEVKVGRWRAEFGNDYCCVTTFGCVHVCDEQKDAYDNFRYQTGNYFKTEEQAEAYKQHLIDRQRVLDKMKNTDKLTDEEFKTLLS